MAVRTDVSTVKTAVFRRFNILSDKSEIGAIHPAQSLDVGNFSGHELTGDIRNHTGWKI